MGAPDLRRKYALTTATLLTLFVGGPVLAASFDCGKATSLLEQTVCADPKLSDFDGGISRAFTAALAPLSPEGRNDLRKGQRLWLHYVQTVCDVDADTFSGPERQRQRALECLHGAYMSRQDQLLHATIGGGHYLIRQVDIFTAHADAPDANTTLAGLHPGFASSEISYPQIDQPRDASQKAFNKLVLDWVKTSNVSGDPQSPFVDDFFDTYEVQYANSQLVSVLLENIDQAQGARDTSTGVKIINWLFLQKRELQTGDVFDSKRHWKSVFRALVTKALDKYEGTCRCLNLGTPEADLAIKNSVTGSWLIRKDGLGVQFDVLDLGPLSAGAPMVIIPWSKLKPYLATESVIALPPT